LLLGGWVDFDMHRYLLLLILIGLAIWGCNQSAEIASKEAIRLLNNENYYFLDVRTEMEHNNKAIPNTPCIPVQEINERLNELEDYRDKKIIVYCRSGNRSGTATKILNENGFDAVNLIGGMNEWGGVVVSSE